MAPVPQWEVDPLRVMRNRTVSASPNRRLARLSICFPIFISAPPTPPTQWWMGERKTSGSKVTFYLNDRPAIHPPLHNPRSWRASRYQGRVLFTNPEYFFHRGPSHRRSFLCGKTARRGGAGWLIWAMRSGRRTRNDRAMEQQDACYGRIEGRRRAKE